jgi:hypothetical protein
MGQSPCDLSKAPRRTKAQNTRGYVVRLINKNEELAASLREMLDSYWGDGNGDTPPKFISRASNLSHYVPPSKRKPV